MRLSKAIDPYVADLKREGRMRSNHTEAAYRSKLAQFVQDTDNAHVDEINRGHVKTFLAHWPNANSQRQAHAILASFFQWAMVEGHRETNPAEQVRRAKGTTPAVYRMTREEVVALMDASMGKRRDKWLVHLGACAGLRNQEIRGLQGRHFARPGWVWVSEDIAKGRKERWMPVTADLEPVVDEIVTLIGIEEYVLPGRAWIDPPHNTHMREDPRTMLSATSLRQQIRVLGGRAGIAGRLNVHSLRHAFGDHMAKHAGLRAAQALLGHASVETTAGTYTDRVTLDELAVSVQGFSFRRVPAPIAPKGAKNA